MQCFSWRAGARAGITRARAFFAGEDVGFSRELRLFGARLRCRERGGCVLCDDDDDWALRVSFNSGAETPMRGRRFCAVTFCSDAGDNFRGGWLCLVFCFASLMSFVFVGFVEEAVERGGFFWYTSV